MKVYLSVDIEGVAGVVHTDQARRSGHDYSLARRLMTAEANAAARGAFDAGASLVLVNDSHADMRNLLIDELDHRVELLSGSLKPLSMVEGAAERFDAALFVGYHAGSGSQGGILDHTYSSAVVARVRVDGLEMNEAGLNALVCGEYGTPVVFLSGDEVTCAQARALLPGIEAVAVKSGVSRYSARSLHPEEARRRIYDGVKRALHRTPPCKPFVLDGPHRLEIDFLGAAMADAAALVPEARREGALTVSYEAQTPSRMLRMLLVLTKLAATTIP